MLSVMQRLQQHNAAHYDLEQMAALTLLLYVRGGGPEAPLVADIGCGLLAVATALTVVSLVQYIRALARFFK